MAATERLLRLLSRLAGVLGGLIAAHPAAAADVPADRAEAMLHVYDGGGVTATGPALLVRKSLADRVSATASLYIDMVSNASIDVVTSASPFKENRTELGLGVDWAVRDALITASLSNSREPDYTASTVGLDIAQDVFGGMTTVNLGFSRGNDDVKKATDIGFADTARHWQYRFGLTQILSPRWLASANLETVADEGYLGSPYRVARVFGAAVPERLPRTRTSRALKLRSIYSVAEGASLRAEVRYFWDTWGIRASTFEVGGTRRLAAGWVAEAQVRLHTQGAALFYSDNAPSETVYVTRNRQLSDFGSWGLGGKLSWAVTALPAQYDVQLTGAYEYKRFNFHDFTDLRTGAPYAHNAHVIQVHVSATF